MGWWVSGWVGGWVGRWGGVGGWGEWVWGSGWLGAGSGWVFKQEIGWEWREIGARTAILEKANGDHRTSKSVATSKSLFRLDLIMQSALMYKSDIS